MRDCPCGSKIKFEDCCQPIILGDSKAETAEQLMRSRYSAFTTANAEYLMKSHHRSTRPTKKEMRNIKSWASSVTWLGLTVISSEERKVNFKAIFLEEGKMDHIAEISRFVKENGEWFYLDGEHN